MARVAEENEGSKCSPSLRTWRAILAGLFVLAHLLGLPAWTAPNEDENAPPLTNRRDRKQLPAKGLIVFKQHIQADEHAPVVEYSLIWDQPGVVDLSRSDDGTFVSVPKGQIVLKIVYPRAEKDLVTENYCDFLRAKLAEFEELEKRFRKSAPFLGPVIARLRQSVAHWDEGKCRIKGEWKDRYELQVAKLHADFRAKRARILGRPYASEGDRMSYENEELPPLWAVAMEQQLKDEQAEFREEYRKRIDEKKQRRSEKFHDSVEKERPFRTGWRLGE